MPGEAGSGGQLSAIVPGDVVLQWMDAWSIASGCELRVCWSTCVHVYMYTCYLCIFVLFPSSGEGICSWQLMWPTSDLSATSAQMSLDLNFSRVCLFIFRSCYTKYSYLSGGWIVREEETTNITQDFSDLPAWFGLHFGFLTSFVLRDWSVQIALQILSAVHA